MQDKPWCDPRARTSVYIRSETRMCVYLPEIDTCQEATRIDCNLISDTHTRHTHTHTYTHTHTQVRRRLGSTATVSKLPGSKCWVCLCVCLCVCACLCVCVIREIVYIVCPSVCERAVRAFASAWSVAVRAPVCVYSQSPSECAVSLPASVWSVFVRAPVCVCCTSKPSHLCVCARA